MNTVPERLDKYKLVERLGHGGLAEVWKALDTQLERHVAIKLLRPDLRSDPKFLMRFQREAQLIASLHHPNIVQIHDFQVFRSEDDSPTPIAYMVMDYVEGETLADYIGRTSGKGQVPSPTEILNIFTSISLAVDYAHQHTMIHRDIKPANILLDKRNTSINPMGEPLLTDFGVARLLGASSNTMSGAQLGTPLYISPEQASGYPGNERSDIYSLAVILYEMVTGVVPFRGDTPHDVIAQHLASPPTPPALINPHVSPALNQVIMRGLAKNPTERQPSASSLTASLAEALNLPVPEALGLPSYPPMAPGGPTFMNKPTFPLASNDATMLQADPTRLASSAPSLQPSWPGISAPGITPSGRTPQTTPYPPPMPMPPAPPAAMPPTAPRRPPKGRRKGLYIALVALLVVVLLGGFGAYLLGPKLFGSQVVGQAFYVSSGQLASQSSAGIADQLQIDLQNIPDPGSGKSYYAWLLGDRNPETAPDLTGPRPIKPPMLLTNNLPARNGSVHYLYPGDAQHNNLISTTSRLLITEETAGQTPQAPSQDRATWRYYGEIPQKQIPGADPGFSALVHIRHLFYDETNIKILGLKGGLDIWLFRNTEKIVEWSVSARDYWQRENTNADNITLMKNQFIRILDYLDGCRHVNTDLPPGTPQLVDPYICRVALLNVNPAQGTTEDDPPGYTAHVVLHVKQVSTAPDVSDAMRQHTAHILDAIGQAETWLQRVHLDAAQLAKFSNNPDQIRQQSTGALLDDMVTSALYAYLGRLDPVTNQVQPGVIQAHYEVQQLAVLTMSKELPTSI